MRVPLAAFLRLIRFARMTALVADIWTIFYAVLIVGWQIIVFLRDGSWRALPLSTVFHTLEYSRGESYSAKIERSHSTNLAEALLQVPTIMPLLSAAALLTAFYFWLSNIERRYSKN